MPIQVDLTHPEQVRAITTPRRRASMLKDDSSAQEFLIEARDQFRTVVNAESQLRANMKNDLDFREGRGQWDPVIRAERNADGRPCLTINRIPQFIRQVTNQQRENRPSIQVDPVDSGADPKIAEALQGIIRNIEMNSDADVAYTTAGEFQVTCGRGYWLCTTEFASDDGHEQVIKIRTIRDPLAVFCDPTYSEPDGRDRRYGFIVEDLPKNYFKHRYGIEALANYEAWLNSRNRSPEWMPEGRVRVAHYFYLDTKDEEVTDLLLPSDDPNVPPQQIRVPSSVLPRRSAIPEDWKILGSRTITHSQCKWALISPCEVLDGNDDLSEGRDFPSKYIPLIQVLGDEINIDGEIDIRGMVRDAKDPQRMYSFWASALTEVIALSPRAPYIGPAGSFKGFETKWNTANRKNYGYLEYNPLTVGGQPANPPQRQQFEPAIQAIVEAFQLADNDMKAVLGLYDASLGKSGPEQSGKAILARQHQGQMGNSNFMDNLGRAIRHTGRVLLDMIPRVYAPQRLIRILGADNKQQTILIHTGDPGIPQDQDQEAWKAAQKIDAIYDISVGRYDISFSEGPAYANRRKEAVEAMLQLVNSYPNAAPMIMDLLVKNMDWPGADEIAARLKAAVPSNVLAADNGGPVVPSDVAQHMQQLEQQVKDLTEKLNAKVVDNQAKSQMQDKQIQADAESDIRDNQAKVTIAAIQAKLDMQLQQFQMEMQRLQTQYDLISKQHDAMIERSRQEDLHRQELAHRQATFEQEQQQARAKAQAEAQAAGADPQAEAAAGAGADSSNQ